MSHSTHSCLLFVLFCLFRFSIFLNSWRFKTLLSLYMVLLKKFHKSSFWTVLGLEPDVLPIFSSITNETLFPGSLAHYGDEEVQKLFTYFIRKSRKVCFLQRIKLFLILLTMYHFVSPHRVLPAEVSDIFTDKIQLYTSANINYRGAVKWLLHSAERSLIPPTLKNADTQRFTCFLSLENTECFDSLPLKYHTKIALKVGNGL